MIDSCIKGDIVQVCSVRDIMFVVDEYSDRYRACVYNPLDTKKEVIMYYSDLSKISYEDAITYIARRKQELKFTGMPDVFINSKLDTLELSYK